MRPYRGSNIFRNSLFEEDELATTNEKQLTDEELKVESLKIATSIAKLMTDVTPEDIINISKTVANFIKGDTDEPLEDLEGDDDADVTEDEDEENFQV